MNKVYHIIGPAWTRTFRCIWMMEELGTPYGLHEEMPQSRGVKKHNPSGKVPILLEYERQGFISLEDSKPSFVLAESVAINNYLGDTFQSTLVPKSGRERAIYDQTILFLLSEIDGQALWMYRKHVHLAKFFGHVPEIEKPCKEHFERMNKLVSDQLINSEGVYLLGKQFTAADILYVHCLSWAKTYGWHKSYSEHLLAYLDRCKQRPAYLKTVAIRENAKQKQQGAHSGQPNSNL
jgi:glutathione S-transferase